LTTLVVAVIFVVIGTLKGSDLVYGVSTSNTCTSTVSATVQANIWITCNNVNLGNVTPGTPVSNTGDVTVNSNVAGGWKLYNYAANYMTRTTSPAQSIANTPSGTPASPEQWNTNTDYGLGFSLSGAVIAAFNSPATWHNGSGTYSYASLTTSSAGAQLVNNYQTHSNIGNNITVLYALDVSSYQLTGTYTAVVSWFAVTHA
jgi:hypothetical protein